ncbi:unnamed protein product [Ambrosiozyma monospora]|uniref:Unnamed protein product n=1 Tax=Ambrosiozyma monospora TaxID=43982 RepID=A0ACB5TIE2_AMBMO|nr:unnamed protein product [Ambrosiozyma monospora]
MSDKAKKAFGIFKDVFIPVAPAKAHGKSQVNRVKYNGTDQGSITTTTTTNHVSPSVSGGSPRNEKKPVNSVEEEYKVESEDGSSTMVENEMELMSKGAVHRKLSGRQLQLIAIGGTIGVGMFTNVSATLAKAGPLSLLLGFSCVDGTTGSWNQL